MASIKTSIELYDNFSDPMMDIVNAANAGTIAIENVQSAMNAGVDMSGINRATAAMPCGGHFPPEAAHHPGVKGILK